MIAVEQAQALILERSKCLPSENCSIGNALGRVLACEIKSPVDLPPFDNSAMDGFALCCGERELNAGTVFEVNGHQAAGDGAAHSQSDGAWEIMTGARLPVGLDAIVPIEQTEVLARDDQQRPTRIRLNASVRPGAHVRRAGEDIALGANAMPTGSWLAPQHLMLLAGLGLATLPLVQRPKVAVLCTGRELVDDPDQVLQSGQIRNSNGPFLTARLPAAGAELVYRNTVADDPATFEEALAVALESSAGIVISTGAVSMGRYDFVPASLRALGAEIVFHKVAMRPGKPLLFAQLAGGQLYFGLPGNPVSSAVGLRFFVEAALRAQLGLPAEHGWTLPLAHAIDKKAGFRLYQKARLELSATGCLSVHLLAGQESFKTLPLLMANAWAALPADAEHLAAGTLVETYALGHESSDWLPQ